MLHGKIGFLASFQGGPTTGGCRIPTAMRFVKITPIEAFDLGSHHNLFGGCSPAPACPWDLSVYIYSETVLGDRMVGPSPKSC